MSERVHDDSMSLDSGSGVLHRAGSEGATYRHGRYLCAEGMVTIYEQVNGKGEQTVRLDTVLDGRLHIRTITRTTRHLTERGIYTVAGRWLREMAEELVL